MGGDHAPEEIVAGAVIAAAEYQIQIILTGNPAHIRPLLAKHGAGKDIQVVPAEETLSMEAGALASWRRPRSSMAVACQLIKRGQAKAVVSAGSTAAVVATARLRLRALPGVVRPGLAVVLPTQPTPTVLIDAGATSDPKPEMLVQFAHLGVAYARAAYRISRPTVGLLTIGSEPGKGNKLARRAYDLLTMAATDPPGGGLPLAFAGNIEGSDLLAGRVDIIVADGFTANVALKTLEGTARYTAAEICGAITASPVARIGALLQRGRLRSVAARLDPENQGGAALLGLDGTVVIAHGAARAKSVASACALAADLAGGEITQRIRERLGPARVGYFLRRS